MKLLQVRPKAPRGAARVDADFRTKFFGTKHWSGVSFEGDKILVDGVEAHKGDYVVFDICGRTQVYSASEFTTRFEIIKET